MGRTGAINAKIRAANSHWNFSQWTDLIHPLDPNLTFCCVLWCLGASGIVSSPYETHFKMGRTGAISAKDHATQSQWNISQITHPIHPIGP